MVTIYWQNSTRYISDIDVANSAILESSSLYDDSYTACSICVGDTDDSTDGLRIYNAAFLQDLISIEEYTNAECHRIIRAFVDISWTISEYIETDVDTRTYGVETGYYFLEWLNFVCPALLCNRHHTVIQGK